MLMFPAGRFSDLTDSSSQGLKYLRDVGLAQSDEEQHEVENGDASATTTQHTPADDRISDARMRRPPTGAIEGPGRLILRLPRREQTASGHGLRASTEPTHLR